MDSSVAIPPGEYVPHADQRVVLHGVGWDGYQALLAMRGDRPRPKVAYLAGAVELMTTSREHEHIKSRIGDLVKAYMEEISLEFEGLGAWTLVGRAKKAGVEPDECFAFGEINRADRPDLAIEVVWTSGGIDKLEIYRRLGVQEVWFWRGGAISVHVLGKTGYTRRTRSARLPELDLALVARLVDVVPRSAAIRQIRAFARER